MRYDFSYSGKRLRLKLSGDGITARELQRLLESVSRMEQSSSEADLRAKVVRQLKKEILQDDRGDDVSSPSWWDVPQDLMRSKGSGKFIAMEADLNPALVYEKTSFSLKVVITDKGEHLALDRDQLKRVLHRLGIDERLSQTDAVLVRVKGAVPADLKDELEDFLRKYLQVERFKFLCERKEYGDRASLDIVLFGDFPLE